MRKLAATLLGALALLAVTVARAGRCRKLVRTAVPSIQAGTPPAEIAPRRRVRWIQASAALLTLILAATGGWFLYDRALPVIPRADEQGEVLVFVDQRNIETRISLHATSDSWPDWETEEEWDDLVVGLTFTGLPPDRPVSFVLAITGTAYPAEYAPNSISNSYRDASNSCGPAVEASTPIDCVELEGSTSVYHYAWTRPTFLIHGSVNRTQADVDAAGTQLTIRSVGPTVVGGDDVRVFQLPRVGTDLIWGPDQDFLLRSFPDLADLDAPAQLTTVVTYDRLAPSEVLDSTSYPVESTAPLTWTDTEGLGLAASGSISDRLDQRAVDRTTFIVGVLLGVITGFLPSAVGLLRPVQAEGSSRRKERNSDAGSAAAPS